MGKFITVDRIPVRVKLVKYQDGMKGLTVSKGDKENGHPKIGDYVSENGNLIAKSWVESNYKKTKDDGYFLKTGTADLMKITSNTDLTGVSVNQKDKGNGHPKPGDYVARNPKNHDDKWLIPSHDAKKFYKV